jgi:tetratricopeptide (TPR) repeat protein
MKGLILTRLDRFSEAEQVFIQLTTNNPDLPEPYNNLAVVYAAQGKYVEAEAALKNAINTHPSYATAHENLGDIYAKMASRAYNQALELDTSNRTAREKLSLVNELISAPPKTIITNKEELAVPVKTEVVATNTQQAEVTSPEPEKENVEEVIAQNRIDVDSAVKNWVNAWSAQDVKTYLASYAQEFVPPNQLSRKEWEKDRYIRSAKPSYIKVTLSGVKINLHGKDYAEIKFTQSYQSNTYSDKVKKELLMRKVSDKWLITKEITR